MVCDKEEDCADGGDEIGCCMYLIKRILKHMKHN